ncbi:MAG: hypothetical protein AABZ47_18715 [Planctomycetota bacterium]
MVVTFLSILAAGMVFVSAVGPLEKTSWRFLRFVAFLAFALSCLASVWILRRRPTTMSTNELWSAVFGAVLCFSAAMNAVMAPIAARRRGFFRLVGLIGGLAGLAAVSLAAPGRMGHDAGGRSLSEVVLGVTDFALSGFLLGGITVAWLLGHAYLTVTTMTIAPLRFYSRLLSWAIVVRSVFFLSSLILAWLLMDQTDTGQSRVWAFLVDSWLIVSLRFGVGLVAVGLFAYMVADCVRLRSTQSATGILYFGSTFAYVGELASQHLTAQLGWPV